MKRAQARPGNRSELTDALRKGLWGGAAVLLVALPLAFHFSPTNERPAVAARPQAASIAPRPPFANAPAVKAPATRPRTARLADFRGARPSRDARRMANWVLSSGDHGTMSFVIVDKKGARVYVFDPRGRLKDAAPALLGEARGDDTAPGVGDKPISQVLPQEKTTPAGRFVAEVGMSTRGEDVVWVDYDAAVSMHRVLKVKERLKSLASRTNADNRMSFGCINLPPRFYEKVLRPSVEKGAVIYVLPETRPLQATFASFYPIPSVTKLAQHVRKKNAAGLAGQCSCVSRIARKLDPCRCSAKPGRQRPVWTTSGQGQASRLLDRV